MSKKEKKKNQVDKATQKKQKIVERNTLQAIPYEKMFKKGICQLNESLFSISMSFSDVNYQISAEEDKISIFEKYMEILNSLSSNKGIQLTVQNKITNIDRLNNDILFKHRMDNLDKYRDEMNEVIKSNFKIGNNAIERSRLITYTTEEETYEDAIKNLNQVGNEYATRFQQLNSKCEVMQGQERLEMLHSIFDPINKLEWNYESSDFKTTKQAIAPSSLDFSSKDHIEIGTRDGIRFAKVLFLKNYSTELSDKLLSDLSKLEYNQTISMHMKVWDNADAVSLIKGQVAKMELQKMQEQKRAMKNGYDPEMIPQELRYSLTEANSLLDDVQQRNQRLFACQFLIMPNCESLDELKEVEKRIKNVGKKHSTEFSDLVFQQEDALGAILPLGYTSLSIERTLTTAVCGTFIPFVSQELSHSGNAFYYGVNAISNNLILCDRRKLLNPSGWILGKPGSGKSFSVKREQISCALWSDKNDIIILDPENEYCHVAELMNGTVINVDNKSNVFINPLDGNIDDDDEFIKSKIEFLQAMSSQIVGETMMNAKTVSIIDRVGRFTYAEYLKKSKTNSNIKIDKPTIADFFRILKDQPETEAQNLAVAFELYVEGSNNLFSKPSNVNVNDRFIVYNINNLGKSLWPLAMLVILESLWDRIIANKKAGRTTWIYIDEIYLLFKSKYCITFFKELWKRGRKYDAIVTGITQNVEELLAITEIRTMLSNSEFILMLNQSSSDKQELMDLLNISDEQSSYVSNNEEGSGLLFSGQVIIPFRDRFPKDTELYKAMTTKPDERKAIDLMNKQNINGTV